MSPARNLGSTGRPEGADGLSGSAAGDSAGQPWAGRSVDATEFDDDDGLAPPALLDALKRFRDRELGEEGVVDVLRSVRLLIPLVTALGADDGGSGADAGAGAGAGAGADDDLGPHGLRVDKTQELSIITVGGPDGRAVLPVFSSAAAMGAWNAQARPVPADAVRVALAAAQEDTDLVVLDPTSDTEFVLRRPALWAIAQSAPWTPSYASRPVAAAFEASISTELAALSVSLTAGDPHARLAGPELIVRLELVDGLSRADLDATLARLAARWAADDVIATGVDSLRVQLVASA
jgi:hypothetical protein